MKIFPPLTTRGRDRMLMALMSGVVLCVTIGVIQAMAGTFTLAGIALAGLMWWLTYYWGKLDKLYSIGAFEHFLERLK